MPIRATSRSEPARSSMLPSLLLTALSSVAACSYHAKGRTISATAIGDPDATRIYNFMRSRDGHDETRDDDLMDEATIASLAPGQVCFDLTIRSRTLIDLHPSQWRIEVNGVPGTAEEIAPRSSEVYTSTITSQEVVLEKTTPRGTTTITAPVEREVTLGYATRHARACAPEDARSGKLRLRVELPQNGADPNWGQVYEWTLRG